MLFKEQVASIVNKAEGTPIELQVKSEIMECIIDLNTKIDKGIAKEIDVKMRDDMREVITGNQPIKYQVNKNPEDDDAYQRTGM